MKLREAPDKRNWFGLASFVMNGANIVAVDPPRDKVGSTVSPRPVERTCPGVQEAIKKEAVRELPSWANDLSILDAVVDCVVLIIWIKNSEMNEQHFKFRARAVFQNNNVRNDPASITAARYALAVGFLKGLNGKRDVTAGAREW